MPRKKGLAEKLAERLNPWRGDTGEREKQAKPTKQATEEAAAAGSDAAVAGTSSEEAGK